jgi:hypothetical protein
MPSKRDKIYSYHKVLYYYNIITKYCIMYYAVSNVGRVSCVVLAHTLAWLGGDLLNASRTTEQQHETWEQHK